jgi:D-glycero-D-manno-heptose 1,7-bisphosphate phosphatase
LRDGAPAAEYARVEVLPGRLEKIERLAWRPGSRFALVTNQGGVAMGHQTEALVWAKLGAIVGTFQCFFGRPFSVHVALHHHHAKVEKYKCVEGDFEYSYRKPGPGMLLEAMDVHRSDTATTWMVGDMDSDAQAARAAGVKYFDAEEFFG